MITKIEKTYVWDNDYISQLELTMKTIIKDNNFKIESIEIFDKTGNYMLPHEDYPKGWVDFFELNKELKKIEAKFNNPTAKIV